MTEYVRIETARVLKEVGYLQDGCGKYHLKLDTWSNPKIVSEEKLNDLKDVGHTEYYYAAPCACEILKQLPKFLEKEVKPLYKGGVNKYEYGLTIIPADSRGLIPTKEKKDNTINGWQVTYNCHYPGVGLRYSDDIPITFKSLVEASAITWLRCNGVCMKDDKGGIMDSCWANPCKRNMQKKYPFCEIKDGQTFEAKKS